jgi:PAS domain S-box-containing protein
VWKFLNPASGKIFETEPAALIGRSIYDMVHPSHKALVESAIYDSPDEKANQFEAAFITKSGKIRWLNWSITLSQKDDLVYMIGRDITEKRKDNEILKARSRQIDVARIITERENYQNEKFRKEQSLIFRTELTSTLGFLSIILAESETLSEDHKNFIENARSSAEGVLNAVKNVLDASYAKISDVTFNIVDVGASEILTVVKEITNSEKFETKLPEKLTLDIELDRNKLKYAFENIAGAIFRLNNNNPIKVFVSENKDDGIIEIEMTSPDILVVPDLFKKVIIEEPSTEDLFKNEEEFNLYISREFIEVMNGSIGVLNDGTGLRLSVMFYENI